MHGKVIAYNDMDGRGIISGDDGQRYGFVRGSIGSRSTPVRPVRTSILKSPATRPKGRGGFAAIFLGGLGIHKFYLGITGAGLIMLLLWLFGCIVAGIPTFIISVIAIIEGIIYLTIYLTKSDEDFYETYEIGKKSWF